MLTSKQRAFLRSKANGFAPVTQVGKDGISPALISQVETAIRVRELIKLHALPNSGYTAREACDALCAAVHAEPVQVIGSMFVIFRKKEKDSAYEI
jgi:RNA-binding protein